MQQETEINPAVLALGCPATATPPETAPEALALVVNKANLLIRTLVEKTPESRYNLRTVHVTKDYTEVTNGHIAVRVSVPDVRPNHLIDIDGITRTLRGDLAKKDAFTITCDDAKRIEESLPTSRTLRNLNVAQVEVGGDGTDDTARFATTALERDDEGKTIAPIVTAVKDVLFPDVERVIPTKKPKLVIGVDAEYMIAVCKAALAVKRHEDKKAKAYVRLSFIDANHVFKVETENTTTGQTFLGLIMPCRL